ncbi:esterase FE4-like [Ostrinia furnacalis]|uniref:esterase FE4-like n=1 Tax=Ostrinia furnacalis TaxID=93504 RepID=UPI00103E0C6C|nr:esterase FE4-like [Ostrinia furnacalis]XP_028172657.1 esterase FE4-like [Ostrinia furnacalis]
MACQVSIAEGVIQGKECTTFEGIKYYSFEGIPYAKPPVGKLRFRDTQPPESWSGVRDCTKPGNKCAQMNPYSFKGFEGSEDCLYLNVYTPSLPAEKLNELPVLFFIHGGRLLIGYGDYYQPDLFMKQNVILVTINYRLHILGFLCLETPEVPGNAGMKDCVAALRWVRRNIRRFNGNENNVTVFGESAGSALGAGCLSSKMSVGLFHKIIAQSGHTLGDVFFSVQDNVGMAKFIASKFGKDFKTVPELYEFYQNLPIEELVTTYSFIERDPPVLNPILMGVVEKKFEGVENFWDESPLDVIRSNRFIKVPTLFGSNMYEGAAFVRTDENGIVFEKDFHKFAPMYLHLSEHDPKRHKIGKAIKRHYFKNKELNDDLKLDYLQMLSDAYFNRDQTYFAELISKHSNELYFYKFHYFGNLNISVMKNLGVKGSTHGDAIQYQFYRKNKTEKCDKRDWAMVNFFREAWTNFAKYGKPSWSNQKLEWTPYDPKEKKMLVINDEITLTKNIDWDNYKFWVEVCGEMSKL